MTTSQNIYAIKDRAPEFPCWLWYLPDSCWIQAGTAIRYDLDFYSHWSDSKNRPSRLEAPKATPSRPASPELPESVRQAVQSALDKFGIEDGSRRLHAECVAEVTAALTPLWPSADGRKEAVTGETSDGYHTFNELYDHRCTLFLALMKAHPSISWISTKHADNSTFGDWFIAGMRLPTGDVTYHLPARMWSLACATGAEVRERGYEWDGHTSADVVKRIQEWLSTPSPVAGLPTPETDLAASQIWDRYLSADDTGDADPVRDAFEKLADFARSLEHRLAAARAEVERLQQVSKELNEQFPVRMTKEQYLAYAAERDSLRAQLERANARIAELTKTQAY